MTKGKVVAERPKRGQDTLKLRLSQLVDMGDNKRQSTNFGDVNELADSIQSMGQQTPIKVRLIKDGPNAGKYGVIAGYRRMTAFGIIAKRSKEDPFVIAMMGPATRVDQLYVQAAENSQVPNTPYERALIIADLLAEDEKRETIIEKMGISPAQYYNLVGLLKLPEPVLKLVQDNKVSTVVVSDLRRQHKQDDEAFVEAVQTAVNNAEVEAKATGKAPRKATARNSDQVTTRTVNTIVKEVVERLEGRKTPNEFETMFLEVLTDINNKESVDKILKKIKGGVTVE
jgi:ParB/RepB/Spo0J family partition protein